MCDGCGCDKLAAPGNKARQTGGKLSGWHVHADGTVHRHEHAHGHSHSYTPVAKRETRQSESGKGDDDGLM